MDDSAITCDIIIELYDEEMKTIKNYNNKKETCKTKKFYNLLTLFKFFYNIIDSC